MIGLIGKSLKHSLSKFIHESITPTDYTLLETDNPSHLLSNKSFKGFNVTFPYKDTMLNDCDVLDDAVKKTNAANTIIHKNNRLYAYNTDYEALLILIKHHFPADKSAIIAIIGNGATMRSVKEALTTLGYKNIHVYARAPKHKNEYALDTIHDRVHPNIIVQTTPVGLYPNNQATLPIDITRFKDLSFVFDVVYNPFKTTLIQTAESLNIKTLPGLPMLVLQALLASEKFFDTSYPSERYEAIFKKTLQHLLNIIFMGLPYAGKTTIGEMLGNRMNKTFIDIDEQIENAENQSIESLFNSKGEPYFRALEERLCIQAANAFNHVISPGGGFIQSPAALSAFKQNGYLVYLATNPQTFPNEPHKVRPLVKTVDDLQKLKTLRHPLYLKHADVMIEKTTLDNAIITKEIEGCIHEYINHQWTKYQSPWK